MRSDTVHGGSAIHQKTHLQLSEKEILLGLLRVDLQDIFVVVDADEGGGFGDDGRWCVGWCFHSATTIQNRVLLRTRSLKTSFLLRIHVA